MNNDIQKALHNNILAQRNHLTDMLVKGKRANIGEVREWSGQKYKKTIQGWVKVVDSKHNNDNFQYSDEYRLGGESGNYYVMNKTSGDEYGGFKTIKDVNNFLNRYNKIKKRLLKRKIGNVTRYSYSDALRKRYESTNGEFKEDFIERLARDKNVEVGTSIRKKKNNDKFARITKDEFLNELRKEGGLSRDLKLDTLDVYNSDSDDLKNATIINIESSDRGPRTDHNGGTSGDEWLSQNRISQLRKPYEHKYMRDIKKIENILKKHGYNNVSGNVIYGEKGHIRIRIEAKKIKNKSNE